MSPITHLLISWSVANTAKLDRKERTLITLAGVVPDFDGLSIIGDWIVPQPEWPNYYWSIYHHLLGHNIVCGLTSVIIAWLLATRRWRTAILCFITFHLHLVGDVVGARGPEGYQWPIPYLWPFSEAWQWAWDGQWALNAWPIFCSPG